MVAEWRSKTKNGGEKVTQPLGPNGGKQAAGDNSNGEVTIFQQASRIAS